MEELESVGVNLAGLMYGQPHGTAVDPVCGNDCCSLLGRKGSLFRGT